MGLPSQTWTLTRKNVLIVLGRNWLSTSVRAFIAPIIFMFFISYAKNFFIPPSDYGVGSPRPIRDLISAFDAGVGNRPTVALVNNGFTGGDIGDVITDISTQVRDAGKTVQLLDNDDALLTTCRSSLRGVTNCFAAATFYSSPTQGAGGYWNYTIHGDGAFGTNIFVNSNTNDAEVYILPLQKAIDAAIARNNGGTIPETDEFPYTSRNNAERNARIIDLYQGTLIKILALAYFIGIVGVTYQLVGQMATERELGMSQLIEAMMPNKRRWEPQAARLLSNHLSFDMIYFPGWLIMGVIVAELVFPDVSIGILIGLHILGGLALTSYSIFFGAFFRKAQLSGITAVLVSLVLAIIAQLGSGPNASTGAVGILTFLFPPMTYTYFIIYTASWQQQGLNVDLNMQAPSRPWTITGADMFGFFVVQIFVFPVLGALIERALYGTASTDRKVSHSAEHAPISVKLNKFTKHFGPGWFKRVILRRKSNIVRAVSDLSLNVRQGQIMILLGANGSGKSTTLDAICGLSKVTSGEIEIDGYGGLGLCPQKNVLWDNLTVTEHVMIFNRLKSQGRKFTKAESQQLARDCDLDVKLNAQAKTLSGGQKRKLQLAMMFTGGSRVCCVDEVSSGIDPLARRKVWDILLAERGRRTILLTTHFLDEADVLSDHIAVLSKGTLRAEGSAVELKHKFGSGYRVFIENNSDYVPSHEFADVPRYVDYDQTVYQFADSAGASAFISALDVSGNRQYRVQGPTVEDVFLKLAEEIKEDFSAISESSPADTESEISRNSKTAIVGEVHMHGEKQMDLSTGQGTGLFRQAGILFRKRLTVLQHNYIPYVFAVLLPVVAAGLVTLFLDGQEQLGCNPAVQSSEVDLSNLGSLISPDIVYGPANLVPRNILQQLYPALNDSTLHTVDTLTAFEDYIGANFSSVVPGGFFIGNGGEATTFAWQAAYDIGQSVLIQNVVDNILAGVRIGTNYASFASPFAPRAGNTLQVILYFGLAMSAYTGFFALYPTAERIRKVRALHYSNGVRSAPLWIAYAAFDFMFVLLISVLAIALWVGRWYGFFYPGYLFVVFFLFGLTSIAWAYLISLFVTSQLAAFAFTAGSQAALFLIYFIAYLCIITYAPVTMIDNWVTIAHFTIALITPSGNLLRALLLTFNEFSLICTGRDQVRPYGGGILVMGGPILYLLVQFFLLMAFTIWWDSGGRISFFKRSANKAKEDAEMSESQDPEVFEELSRVTTGNDGLRVLHLNKAFDTNLAVDDVTFGIRKGETFALLGPNGAGKSTTISLVRGDLRPSYNASEVFVEDKSIMHQRVAARNNLGVCPQFDAMDSMTVLSHLRFYAKVRGVPDVEHNVQEVMRAVGIQMYKNRMAAKLSGGNKRKLSLGIALMGNPSVLLLDEPSSGMDAAAKRVMWRVLGSVTQGRALLITTHSMEEADALAKRAGIMAKRMLALGTTDQLRRRHGDAYHVHLVHKEAPHTSTEEMERVKTWVRTNIPTADLEERTYHGQLRFSVPNAVVEKEASGMAETIKGDATISQQAAEGKGVSALFHLLESHKEELGFAYYGVQPTTLDQVFLNVVRKHNVEEENYAKAHQGKQGWRTKISKAVRSAVATA